MSRRSAAARAPAAALLLPGPFAAVAGSVGVLAASHAVPWRAALRGVVEDRVDEVGLAQAAKTVEPKLIGDRMQVGERAGLQLGALEY